MNRTLARLLTDAALVTLAAPAPAQTVVAVPHSATTTTLTAAVS